MTKNHTKISTRRLIISGDSYELYTYGLPYAYNFAPLRSSRGDMKKLDCRRGDNLAYVRMQIRRLVNANVRTRGYEPVFLTFTFAENICDVPTANKYFSDFIERLNYAFGKRHLYLAIVEFQKRGAVHYHCIFFNMAPEVEDRERAERRVAKLWSHGFVDIERIRSARRVAPYVCKYLDKAVHDKRLLGKKAFFTSRGLLRPRLIRDEQRIDKILARSTLVLEHEVVYDSTHYKQVTYKQYARVN